MPNPGEPGGDCVRCDSPTTLVGYDGRVFGTHCDTCDFLHALTGTAMTTHETMGTDFSDFEVREYADYGPDPWG